MIRFLIAILLVFVLTEINAQSDFKDTRKEVERLRLAFKDHIEIKVYDKIPLNLKINNFHYVLSKTEEELVALLRQEFNVFIAIILRTQESPRFYDDHHVRDNPYGFIRFPKTKLFAPLLLSTYENMEQIRAALEMSNISNASKDYITFYLNNLEFRKDQGNNEKQLALVQEAIAYKKKYPLVSLSKKLKNRELYEEPGAFAMDFSTGISFGFYEDELGQRLDKIWGFDLEMRFYLHNFFLGLKGHVTFNKSKDAFVVNNYQVIEGRKGIAMTYVDAFLGRGFHFNERVSLFPFVGYSTTEFSIQQGANPEVQDSWEWTYTQGMIYGFDLQVGMHKRIIQKTIYAKHKRTLTYSNIFWRFSAVLRNPNLIQIDPILNGYATTFSLGVGLNIRGTKRHDITVIKD